MVSISATETANNETKKTTLTHLLKTWVSWWHNRQGFIFRAFALRICTCAHDAHH